MFRGHHVVGTSTNFFQALQDVNKVPLGEGMLGREFRDGIHFEAVVGSSAAVNGESFLVYRAETALTVNAVDCLVNAATSTVVTVEECDADGGSCVGTAIATGTCATTNTALTVNNSDVDASDWIRLTIGTVTGIPEHVTVCVRF